MSKNTSYRPRIVIDVPAELKERVDRVFPYGWRGKFFEFLISEVVSLIEKKGIRIVLALMEKHIKLKDAVEAFKEADNKEQS